MPAPKATGGSVEAEAVKVKPPPPPPPPAAGADGTNALGTNGFGASPLDTGWPNAFCAGALADPKGRGAAAVVARRRQT